jgi:metal-responsive CopG/Arc/MetJ family transcriptional regulator
MRTITFKIEEDLLELLDMYAMKHKISRSEAIREGISKIVDEIKNEHVPKARIEVIELRVKRGKAKNEPAEKTPVNVIELRDMNDSTKDEPIIKAHIEKMRL